ncbi:MAG TPA: hypothetical protein VF595_05420 [Tepidisphaeraceae bacterium]|jgi:hypothetical protein
MYLYQQTTEASKYLAIVGGLAASTVDANVSLYKRNRAATLGLPLQQTGPNGQAIPVGTSTLKLAARLAALGPAFGPLMVANSEHKAFIEGQVAAAVTGLGGWDKILPTGEWAFLLEDAIRDAGGKITGYSLPGLTFVHHTPPSPNVPAQAYTVTIDVDPTNGIGTATFTSLTGNDASSDPL